MGLIPGVFRKNLCPFPMVAIRSRGAPPDRAVGGYSGQKKGDYVRISRRDFFTYCRNSSAALALGATQLSSLEKAMAATTGPTVLWLQGAACTGCSVSFLNRISPTAPVT